MTQTNLFNPTVYRWAGPELKYPFNPAVYRWAGPEFIHPINPAVYRWVNYRNHPQQRASARCDHGLVGTIVGARHAVPLLYSHPLPPGEGRVRDYSLPSPAGRGQGEGFLFPPPAEIAHSEGF